MAAQTRSLTHTGTLWGGKHRCLQRCISVRPSLPSHRQPQHPKHPSASASPVVDDIIWPNPLVTDVPTVTSPEESLGQRWKRYSHIALSSALLLLADVGMKTSMNGLNIQFPHTLAGMLILSIGLIAAKSAKGASGKAADAVLEFFQPLLAWVARWMPVFFVPALIALPMSLATASVQASDFLKVGQVLVLGWTSSMLLVTVALKALRSLFHTELTDQEAVTTAPKPVSPFTPAHYLTWGLISLATLGMSAGFPNHAPTFGSLFLLASTVKGYLLGVALPAPLKVVFHPIIVCSLYGSACCKLLAWVSGMGYHDVLSSYMHKGLGIPGAGAALMSMLTVVVLCDGMRVYLQRSVVRRHAVEIFGAVLIVSVFSLFFTAHVAASLQLSPEISRSLLPRSITVALALPMTQMLGGIESLTTAMVCATGLVGAALGQLFLGVVRMRDEISRGVAQASCSHGLGASAMAATEPQALPFCAVTIAIMGTVSNILLCVPYIRTALLAITG